MPDVISDNAAKANVSDNVSRLLAEKGWTQQDLAEATGENKMTISRVVRGQNCPGIGLMARIAEALDVTVDELLESSRKKVSRSA